MPRWGAPLTRRRLMALAGAGLCSSAASAQAQRVYRIGYLTGGTEAASAHYLKAFRQGLNELGYSDASAILSARYAGGKFDRLPALARELLDEKPDALLVATTPGNLAAKAATSTVPIVMVAVADPVATGIVQSLARPGGNITGVTNIVAEVTGKRLALLKELMPGLAKVAVLYNPDDANAELQLREARAAAQSLGIELGPLLAIRKAADVEPALNDAAREAQAALRLTDPLVNALGSHTARMAARYRLPTIYPFREVTDAGGLISYGTSLPDHYRQAASYMHKVLQGARPADLPVQRPTRFELVINLRAAKALGLAVPQSLLARADEVIE